MNNDGIISYSDFEKIDMRVGTIIQADIFHEAKNPAYKLVLDFGEFGHKKSSAQITDKYTTKQLIGKQIIAIINFPVKQIANMMSECLVLGAVEEKNIVTLLGVESQVKNGTKIL